MKLYLITIPLAIGLSYGVTKYFLSNETVNLKEKNLCPEVYLLNDELSPHEESLLEDKSIPAKGKVAIQKSSCLETIITKGDSFEESSEASRSKIYDLFVKDLEEKYERPNEWNVATNENDFGTSAQEYDPRLGILVRFQHEKEDKEVPKIDSFIITSSLLDQKKDTSVCSSPSFKKLDDEEVNEKLLELMDGGSRYRERSLPYYELRNEFRGISLNAEEVYVPYDSWRTSNLGKFYQNFCSGGLSMLKNLCYFNLSYDMQFQEIFYVKDQNSFLLNTYCKKSADDTWTRLYQNVLAIGNK